MLTADTIFENINQEIQNIKQKYFEYESTIAEQYKMIFDRNIQLWNVLKSMVGHKIYWAHEAWVKYETHTISKIEIGIVETDFFGAQYKNKSCIKIHVEDGGYYIADQIGETLFFDEQDAQAHSRKVE